MSQIASKRAKKIIIQGDGNSLWTITHAEDFAKGFVGLLGHQQAIGHAFHITSDEILTWNQIYEALASAVDKEPDVVHISSDFICQIEPEMTGTLIGDKAVFRQVSFWQYSRDKIACEELLNETYRNTGEQGYT